MSKYDLKEELFKRDNFKMAIEYAKRKGYIFTTIDSMESYYIDIIDGEHHYLDNLPEGKQWTSHGSNSVDISVEYFPDLKTFKGWKSLFNSIVDWIKSSIEESYLWKYPPFTMWENWVFVLDSWDSVRYEMVDKKEIRNLEEYNLNVSKVKKEDVIDYLNDSPYYNKLNEKFYYSKNDPTCIISMDNHDFRDGYSHEKIVSLLNEWIDLILPHEKSINFIYKKK